MNCPICYDDSDSMYTIACGAKTPHQICNTCEISLRLASTPTNLGRFIKCPMCRVVEPVQGIRSIQSYQAELLQSYMVAPFVLIRAPEPLPNPSVRTVRTVHEPYETLLSLITDRNGAKADFVTSDNAPQKVKPNASALSLLVGTKFAENANNASTIKTIKRGQPTLFYSQHLWEIPDCLLTNYMRTSPFTDNLLLLYSARCQRRTLGLSSNFLIITRPRIRNY